jgi:ATP-dependent DNA helicase RecQ
MLQYASSTDKCRSQTLLEYFGEPGSQSCGECDICRIKKESVLRQEEFNLIREEILAVLNLEPLSPDELFERVAVHRDKVIEVLQWLLDNDELKLNGEMKITVSKK